MRFPGVLVGVVHVLQSLPGTLVTAGMVVLFVGSNGAGVRMGSGLMLLGGSGVILIVRSAFISFGHI